MSEPLEILDYRDPDWLADRLGLDKNTVYKFLQDGTIPAVQLGRKWLISEQRLAEWLRSETERQTRARREAATSADRTVRRLDSFTHGARLALKHAHSEARRYAHPQLGQEHLLLGLATDAHSPTARALRALSITPDVTRLTIEQRLTPGATPPPRRLGRDADAKRAMRLASRLAERDAASLVGTDHLLTGILLARQGLGHEILARHGVTRQRLRQALHDASQLNPISNGDNHER